MLATHSRRSSLQLSDPPSIEDTITTSSRSASHTVSVRSHTASQAASHSSSIVVDLEALPSKPGDLGGVLACINAGDDLERTITMTNASMQPVHGVTALYVAAQKGYLEMCKLLVQNGADCDSTCRIGSSGDRCTAAHIAQIHGHYRTWWYLSRRQEKRSGLAKLIPRRNV